MPANPVKSTVPTVEEAEAGMTEAMHARVEELIARSKPATWEQWVRANAAFGRIVRPKTGRIPAA